MSCLEEKEESEKIDKETHSKTGNQKGTASTVAKHPATLPATLLATHNFLAPPNHGHREGRGQQESVGVKMRSDNLLPNSYITDLPSRIK